MYAVFSYSEPTNDMATSIPTQPLQALSIRQPWAWLIIRPDLKTTPERAAAATEGLIKNIENRTWWATYTGPLIIHASKGCTHQEYLDCQRFLDARELHILLPKLEDFQFGGVIGRVTMIGATHCSLSKWFTGPNGFVFKDAEILKFKPCRGKQGFFTVEI